MAGRRQHPGFIVAPKVLEELLVGRRHGDFVVQAERGRRAQSGQVAKRGTENRDMCGMGFRPPLEVTEAAPPTHPERLVQRVAVVREHGHVPVREAPEGSAGVSQEVHSGAEDRFDVVQIQRPLIAVCVGPVLSGADQAQIVHGMHACARPVVGDGRSTGGFEGARSGDGKPVTHTSPVAVLADLTTEGLGDSSDTLEPVDGGEECLETSDLGVKDLDEEADAVGVAPRRGPLRTYFGEPPVERLVIAPIPDDDLRLVPSLIEVAARSIRGDPAATASCRRRPVTASCATCRLSLID